MKPDHKNADKHGKHADNVARVEAAVQAAGSDPRARFQALVFAVAENAGKLNNPADAREAIQHLTANIEGLTTLVFGQ